MTSGVYARPSVAERFAGKFIRRGNDECWEWTSFKNKHGYGMFLLHGKKITAHRAALILLDQLPVKGFEADHKCKNRSCVNPKHLRFVPKSDNLRNRVLIKEVCRRGHILSPDNLHYENNGPKRVRRCKKCLTIRKQKKEKE